MPTVQYPSIMAPWEDVSVLLLPPPFETAIVLPEPDDPSVVEFFHSPFIETAAAAAPDFDITQYLDGSRHEQFAEYRFESWVEIPVEVALIVPPSFYTAIFTDESYIDPVLEFSFDPWAAVDTATITAAPSFDLTQYLDGSAYEQGADWTMEPWVEIATVEILASAASDFVPLDELLDPVVEFYFEPWSAVDITATPAHGFDITQWLDGSIHDQSAEWSMEPWVEVEEEEEEEDLVGVPSFGTVPFIEDIEYTVTSESFEAPALIVFEALIDVGEFTTIYVDDDLDPVSEWSMEAWAAVAMVDAPDFDTAIPVEPIPDPEPFEFAYEPWSSIEIVLIAFPDFDTVPTIDPVDDPSVEWFFDKWDEIIAVVLVDFPDFETVIQVETVPDPLPFDLWNDNPGILPVVVPPVRFCLVSTTVSEVTEIIATVHEVTEVQSLVTQAG